ncbi:MAG: hypothetical protein BWY74_03912 [Firmicutes bacterium ADurb.Bin419]|nr:MAG: hypothetical protein BWY74_03912 [Firmicutes bacterium ADurb.Bin419]
MFADFNHNIPKAPNLLTQDFNVSRACAVWITDITHIVTGKGKLYLTSVKNLYNKEKVRN